VVFFRETDGTVPVVDWLETLSGRAQAKCRVKIERLREMGYELRRPEADFLRDDIYELRVGLQGVNYRMLYFFHGRIAAVVSHGIVKEGTVPAREIALAIKRKEVFQRDPSHHTHEEVAHEEETRNDQ
jgi:hypothetical protein